MEKNIQLIALDMDGTLLQDNHEVSSANRAAIVEAKAIGIHIVLSTGRSIMTCKDYAEDLGLNTYLVTVNGSEVWDSQGNLLEQNLLDKSLVEMMWGLRTEHNTGYWAISSEKIWRGEFPEDISSYNWLKFGFDIEDDEVREKIHHHLSQHEQLEVSNSSPTNLEVNAVGINKANALKKVCSRIGITMDNVMAMGDSMNDIIMIQEAGIGVAMGNAQQKVKDAADWITTSNNEDGVAQAIERFVLG